jgi:hypothetical protein
MTLNGSLNGKVSTQGARKHLLGAITYFVLQAIKPAPESLLR